MIRARSTAFSSAALLLLVGLVAGCASVDKRRPSEATADAATSSDRKIVKTADLRVSVSEPEAATGEVERIVSEAGGSVEQTTATKDASAWLRCRVPSAKLDQVMDAVAALGDEQRRYVSMREVTDQYTDLETRLRNGKALRDKLQRLLERARDVEDVLAIEKELNRIQSEIETTQAAFDRLSSEIALSALSITLERRQILGPLGWIGYGLWWVVAKLFVIR